MAVKPDQESAQIFEIPRRAERLRENEPLGILERNLISRLFLPNKRDHISSDGD